MLPRPPGALTEALAWVQAARWLGPWSGETQRPSRIRRSTAQYAVQGGGTVKAWCYQPDRPASRAVLLCPGIHYDGPADVRLDRLSRILASTGARVVVPFFADSMELRVSARAIDEAAAVFAALVDEQHRIGGPPAAIFSISFGSLPALRTAARFGAEVSELVLFGGYVDPAATISFALTGEVDGERLMERDPLNHCVVYITLLDALDLPRHDSNGRLHEAWMQYARRTWGRPELKRGDAHGAIAREVAEHLKLVDRELFLMGCGLIEGSEQPCLRALEQLDATWMDPGPWLSSIQAPVTLIHGADDDVIPVTQAHRLVDALRPWVPVTAHITGLYGHTGVGAANPLAAVRQAAAEGETLVRMLHRMATLGTDRRSERARSR
jgi:pimeloyl-ACP methyl ester carboxylesterase